MNTIQTMFVISLSIVWIFLMVHNIQRILDKDKNSNASAVTSEYTKLLRICVLKDIDDTVSVKLIDLEKSKYIILELPKSHIIFEQADRNGLITAKCQLIGDEEIYPDIPEVSRNPAIIRYFCR